MNWNFWWFSKYGFTYQIIFMCLIIKHVLFVDSFEACSYTGTELKKNW